MSQTCENSVFGDNLYTHVDGDFVMPVSDDSQDISGSKQGRLVHTQKRKIREEQWTDDVRSLFLARTADRAIP